ncbi:temptin-like [Physella acuta]|uniref:temptin-like n=1 Tax=Physella acuta TaxID=109671 RepID=UPI0027DCB320|nr:temptin-like [Physella acuta]
MTKSLRSVLVVCLTLTLADAYRRYQDLIPNGHNVPEPCSRNLWPGVGHNNIQGGGQRNLFGRDFECAGSKWTVELCRQDSDNDGVTNGQELGDPDCKWTQGSIPTRIFAITHPGIPDS